MWSAIGDAGERFWRLPGGGRLCLLRRFAHGFFVNLLKTGDFEKHYMLSSLRLMRSICCDNVPLDLRTATESPALPPLASERVLLQGVAGQRGGREATAGSCREGEEETR